MLASEQSEMFTSNKYLEEHGQTSLSLPPPQTHTPSPLLPHSVEVYRISLTEINNKVAYVNTQCHLSDVNCHTMNRLSLILL